MKTFLFIIAAIVLSQIGSVVPANAEMNVMPSDQMEETTGNEGICLPEANGGCLTDTRKDKTSPLDHLDVIEEMEEGTQTLPENDPSQTTQTATEEILKPKPKPYESPYDPETTQTLIDTINQIRDNMY